MNLYTSSEFSFIVKTVYQGKLLLEFSIAVDLTVDLMLISRASLKTQVIFENTHPYTTFSAF